MVLKSRSNTLLTILLAIMGTVFLFPFLWMILSSLKSANEVFDMSQVFPSKWRWGNFIEVFRHQPFARQYLNSIYITTLVTAGTMIIGSLSGFAFARIDFPGRNILFILVLSGLMIPVEVAIIPNFFRMRDWGLTNTHVPLILIPMLGAQGVLATFMIRQFFLAIPKELEEAARIDGLSAPGIFLKIFVPLSGSVLSTVAILTALYSWNSFLEPLVYVNDIKLYTVPLALNNFTDAYGLPMQHVQLAATTLAVVPILIVYSIAQEKITSSLAGSGMKG